MRSMTLTGLLAAGILLTACGGSAPLTESAAQAETAVPTTEATSEAAPVVAAAKLGETELGPVLTDADGRTLYGFTNDVEARSTCSGACADAWPPVIVDEDWSVGPGVDVGVFATTQRDDGQLQLVAGAWPLYAYAGDAAPGDASGQGSGGVWFAIDPAGELYGAEGTAAGDTPTAATDGDLYDDASGTAAPAATDAGDPDVSIGDTDLGEVLVDADGRSLYGFTEDADGQPTCEGDCADAWPPVTIEGDPELAEGLDLDLVDTVERPDGTHQVVVGVWPLYRFAGDGAPGEVNGQASGDVWFVVAPDGSLVR